MCIKTRENSGNYIEKCPEGRGVNVTSLMESIDVKLNWDWPPEHNLENKTYIVSLGGFKVEYHNI